MEDNKAVQTYHDSPVANALRPADIMLQVNLIQEVMLSVMKDGEHFGKIPGCGDKPTLLKAGAEKLIMTFRLVPDIEEQVIEMPREHREYRIKVKMYSQDGIYLGSGVGSCSTMEGKFRFRKGELTCPECGATSIIKGKTEFGGGWICYARKGGCGKKWTDQESPFEGMSTDKVEHNNPADYYNTCLKMGKKRAMVDALLTVTAASDIFTQDIEDMPQGVDPSISQPESTTKSSTVKPAPKPQAGNTVTGLIEKIMDKKGTNQKTKKPWTLYLISVDGQLYSTFSDTDNKTAEDAHSFNCPVTIEYEQVAQGRNIKSIKPAEDIPEAKTEAEPEPVNKCLSCVTVNDCMLTPEQMKLCDGPHAS